MKRERVEKHHRRVRDRRDGPLPLSTREIFYPYPIKPSSPPRAGRAR